MRVETGKIGRTPQGVRGLKPGQSGLVTPVVRSHSARSAWIETGFIDDNRNLEAGRTPQGVRGLKLQCGILQQSGGICRTPQGVRGLKLLTLFYEVSSSQVALRKECVD